MLSSLALHTSFTVVHFLLCGNGTHRVLYVDTHCLVLLLFTVDLVQLPVGVLAGPAQLRVIPLRRKERSRRHGGRLDAG